MNLTRNSIVAGLTVLSVAVGAAPAMAKGGGDGAGDSQAAGTTGFFIPPTVTPAPTNGGGGGGGGGKPLKFSGGVPVGGV
jgi:hypothetical protein